jgi:hypothetical protein
VGFRDVVMKDRRSNKDDGRIRPGINCKRNPERTDARKKKTDAAGRHIWNQEPRLRAATAWKRKDNQRIRQEGFRTGVRKASNRDVQRVAENEELDLVERSAPSEAEKEAAHGIGAGDVGAPTTQGVMVHRGKEIRGRALDCIENLG